jgi:uncharacterized membrane protein
MAGFDEIVFHQLLGWHHLDDRSTLEGGLRSDGVLHALELVVLVTAIVVIASLVRGAALVRRSAVGGAFVGAGGFQLFDGVVVHKVLGLHQVRYGVDLLPYDVAWNAGAAVLLVVGLLIVRWSTAALAAEDDVTRSAGSGTGPPRRRSEA